MAITLESIEDEAAEEVAEEAVDDAAASAEIAEPEESAEIAEPEEIAEVPVVPKPRGRPKKTEPAAPKAKPKAKARPKAAVKNPPSPVYESSSDEETPMQQEELDTMLMQFLLHKKQNARDSRREMWKQMAGLA